MKGPMYKPIKASYTGEHKTIAITWPSTFGGSYMVSLAEAEAFAAELTAAIAKAKGSSS